MIEQHSNPVQHKNRLFLPLGSIVILKGSVKKLLIVSRGSIVEDEFFDYGAFLYPEGMFNTNIAYFNHDDILKTVFEGYSDADEELALEILNTTYTQFQANHTSPGQTRSRQGEISPDAALNVPVSTAVDDDLFASVRNLGEQE